MTIQVAALEATLGMNIQNFTKGIETAGNKMKSFGKSMTSVGKSMTLGVTAPILGAGVAAIKFASDAEEIQSKFNVVFGKMAKDSNKWAEDFGNSVGRGRTDIKSYMATLQDTFVPLGFARDKSAEYSKTLTKLAIDVASFNNASDADVIRDFQSAMVGNHETVRKYGVIITEATLMQEALSSGLVKANTNTLAINKANLAAEAAQKRYNEAVKEHGPKSLEARTAQNALQIAQEKLTEATKGGKIELTEQQKVQARMNILMKGTTDAQGDAERTAGSFANQMKQLNANVKNAGEDIGKILIPYALKLVHVAQDLIGRFGKLSPTTQKIILVVAGLAAAIGPLLIVAGMLISATGTITTILPVLGAAFAAITWPIGLAIAAVVALIAIGVAVYKNWDVIKAKASQAWGAIKGSINSPAVYLLGPIGALIGAGVSLYKNWDTIKSKASSIFNSVKTTIANAIAAVKRILSVSLSFPKVKLPHFSISGGFSLTPPKVPSLSVKWYKDGGIFNSPSVIGVGEAGPEAVVPLNKAGGMGGDQTIIIQLDGRVLAEKTLPYMPGILKIHGVKV